MDQRLIFSIVNDVYLTVWFFTTWWALCKYNKKAEWAFVLLFMDGTLLGGVYANTIELYALIKAGG